MSRELLKDVFWHGDALELVRGFPRSVRVDIGAELYLLQLGEPPLHSRPFSNIGRGVREIRVQDRGGEFRVFYFVMRRDGIHVLHAFRKKTQKTSKSDIEIGRARYRNIRSASE